MGDFAFDADTLVVASDPSGCFAASLVATSGNCHHGPFSLLLLYGGPVRPGVKADRIPRTPAVQAVQAVLLAVPFAVHPDRARAQDRAARPALGRLAGDHRGHVAVAALPGVAGRRDPEPGPVGRALFHRELD